MLFWIKFLYTAGVSLSCDMVVKRAGTFIVHCTSKELSPIYIHSSMNAFFKASMIEIYFITIDPLCGFSFSPELSSAGVAPLPPRFHKILNETVTTFCRFSLVDVPSRW